MMVSLRPAPPSQRRSATRSAGIDTSIEALPNLGPKSRTLLAIAGIESVAQLRRMGSVAAYVQVKRSGGTPSLNLLWALEGALTGLPWQAVARVHRTSLLLALEQLETTGLHAPDGTADVARSRH
jgi:DNA transformation protein